MVSKIGLACKGAHVGAFYTLALGVFSGAKEGLGCERGAKVKNNWRALEDSNL